MAGLTSAAGWPTSAGRLTGLLAADLFLIQVVMMARIPVLERAFGQDDLVRRHRSVGKASFVLLRLHVPLITQGYAISSGLGLLTEFVDLVVNYQDMVAAVVASLLIVLVVVSSVRQARRRLRYESWHLIHLYAYVGIFLAVPHELSLGKDLSGSVESACWRTIYGTALAAVLIWRVALPLQRSVGCRLQVDRVVREGPDVLSVYIRGRSLKRLNAKAGQFFVWRFLGGRGWTRGHPYSLSAAPNDRNLRITVKGLGDGSHALAQLRPGTRVLAEGPHGRMHQGERQRRKVLLMASGIGITPIRALLEDLDAAPGDLTVLYRAATDEALVLQPEIDLIAAARGAQVHYLLGPRRRTQRRDSWLPVSAGGLSDVEVLKLLVPQVADHEAYLCGPTAWITAARRSLLQAAVAADRIHHEFIDW